MANYIICTRNIEIKKGKEIFGNEPGDTSFLIAPDDATDILPSQKSKDGNTWLKKLLVERKVLDILVFVHGYNMNSDVVLERHKVLKQGLKDRKWNGELVTFAWPSKSHTALYWEDRFDALNVASKLVTDGIKLLDEQMKNGCTVRVHVIAHSTGALIAREAFNIGKQAGTNWAVGQMIFIAGDISSNSMIGSQSEGLFKHSGRITNYFSQYDAPLAVSGAKRLGFENRVGRVGLPLECESTKAVDVNCTEHYKNHEKELERVVKNAALSHSWHFWSKTFMDDLVYTLSGELDRNVIPTRYTDQYGEFHLIA